MDSNYFVLEVDQVHVDFEDLLTMDLFELGAAGVQENLEFSQRDRKYLPEVLEKDLKKLTVYFEQRPDESELMVLNTRYPQVRLRLTETPSRDWLSEWKAQWAPFEMVAPFWVVPDWERQSFDVSHREPIYIEPGMAFGTGTHATTQVASQLIVQASKEFSLTSALDVGTGSGILSLLLNKLGVSPVYAYDNDPEAHRVFHENLEKNASQAQWIEAWGTLSSIDLCVANIIDGVLLDLKPQFQKLGARFYVFTGVLLEREKDFLEEMKKDWDLRLHQRLEKEEWVGFLFEAQP